jgi:hypothetical protein
MGDYFRLCARNHRTDEGSQQLFVALDGTVRLLGGAISQRFQPQQVCDPHQRRACLPSTTLILTSPARNVADQRFWSGRQRS